LNVLACTGLFRDPASYMQWERTVHLISTGAMVAAGAGVLIWVLARLVLPSVRGARIAAYACLALALAGTMITLAVVGTAPLLQLTQTGMADVVALRIQRLVKPATPSINVTAEAARVARAILAHLNEYQQGRWSPTLKQGYSLALVNVEPQSDYAPYLSHGNMAPIGNIGHQVSLRLDQLVSTYAIARAAAARDVAVGVTEGLGITYDHRLPVLLVVVLVR
jgi:hypothetical protein